MKLFREEHDESLSSINVTPLTDCMLVLLIIFMIAGTAVSKTGFGISLPKAEYRSEQESHEICISVTKGGTYYINGREVSQQNLKEELENAGSVRESAVIEADSAASYAKVIYAVDSAKRAGFGSVSLSAETE